MFCEAFQLLKEKGLSSIDELPVLVKVVKLAGSDTLALADSVCTQILKREINNHRDKILSFAEEFNLKELKAACTEHMQ